MLGHSLLCSHRLWLRLGFGLGLGFEEEPRIVVGVFVRLRKWEGFGWAIGTISEVNEKARRSIARDKVNFFVTLGAGLIIGVCEVM